MCRATGLEASTVRGIARTLSTVLTQAVEDELLPANAALRLGRYLRTADDPEPEIDPFTRADTTLLLEVCRVQFPEWYPWLLCGHRTGMQGAPITYVARQLGHKHASITLRVYAHWLPDGSRLRAVELRMNRVRLPEGTR